MPEHWQESTLGEVADYLNGFPFKPKHLMGASLPVIRIKQLIDPSEVPDRTDLEVAEKHHIDDGDIVFSWSATLAVRIWSRGPALLNQHLFKVVPKAGVSARWLSMALEHAIDDLVGKSHGTTMKHITKKSLEAHPVLLPPLEEQRRIVDLVGSIDTYIDSLETQIETTRTARAALLSEVLSNPGDDWQETTLGELSIAGLFTDGDWVESKDQDPSGGNRLLQLADVGDGVFVNKSDRWMNDEQFERLRCTPVEVGDVLIARMPDPIARACLVPQGLPRSCVAVDVAICRPPVDVVHREMLVMLINDHRFRSDAEARATGTTRKRVSRKNLASISFRLPPMEEQRRIGDLVGSVDDQIAALESQVESVRAFRTGVLSELLSGERLLDESYDVAVGL